METQAGCRAGAAGPGPVGGSTRQGALPWPSPGRVPPSASPPAVLSLHSHSCLWECPAVYHSLFPLKGSLGADCGQLPPSIPLGLCPSGPAPGQAGAQLNLEQGMLAAGGYTHPPLHPETIIEPPEGRKTGRWWEKGRRKTSVCLASETGQAPLPLGSEHQSSIQQKVPEISN